jgi:hypothetical protein
VQKVRLAFLQRDRVHDRLALNAPEAGFDDRPLRAVDHDRHARDFRLRCDVVQERPHGALGVEHRLIDVDVNHVGAAADLIGGDPRGLTEVVGLDQPLEPLRPGHVRPLADHLEVAVFPHDERLQT